MKFAEHLQNSVVPEWKDKYLDYRLGKKKLKLLLNCGKILSKPDLVNEFIEDWLISVELNKINNFYLWLLKNCSEKFSILEKQLNYFKYQCTFDENPANVEEDDVDDESLSVTNRVFSYGSFSNTDSFFKNISNFEKLIEFLKNNEIMPSLPSFKFGKDNKRHGGTETFIHDFNADNELPNLNKSQYLLGNAILEFYLYIQLVKTYRDLNITGFKKIIKKFDKIFAFANSNENNYDRFVQYAEENYSIFKNSLEPNKEFDPLTSYENIITNWYMVDLTKDHSTMSKKIHNNKLKKLTVGYSLNEQMIHRNNRSIAQMFFAGISMGISFLLILITIYITLSDEFRDHQVTNFAYYKIYLPLWGGWYMIFLISALFIADCFIWHRTHINYRFIMFGEIHTKFGTQFFNNDFATSLIPLKLYFLNWFSLPISILAVVNFFLGKKIITFIYLSIAWTVFLFLLPPKEYRPRILNIPYWDKLIAQRFWLIKTFIRLIFSGLFPVEFSDFFLGDIVCSLTYSMADLATFACIQSPLNRTSLDPQCGSSRLKSMGVLSCVPSYWRCMQCLRRYADSDDWFPHLFNAGKYIMGICYNASLSAYRLSDNSLEKRTPFLVFATLNSLYTCLWDIIMDWSLLQNLASGSENRFLRNDLYLAGKKNWKTGKYSTNRKLFYYFAMITDVILRFQWIIYAIRVRTIQQSAMTSFVLATTEVFRRFLWIIFRVENEHVANVHHFKVSGNAPLPYPDFLVNKIKSGTDQHSPICSSLNLESFGDNSTTKNNVVDASTFLPSSSTTNVQGFQTPPSTAYHGMFRRETSMFDNISKSIPWAHASDFQRPIMRSSAVKLGSDSESENGDS
ncbi:hypothetical protein TPHA_0K00960 [Tetrapisispora phaffii CBS 4417]|uniref:EXS domain-containing protein n=1 Tax=Tetrapisispora phaffii (strain ATCC 24235 / CBS 4417 / NBRC 1672 / NRRL Y-8282 / UCD 70-5) TaxID=1071381 RepID=G8BZA2_TETPH|nr:hypothetical protein TPHA_0K00960 [Tetrapisispora phaffii CBS 4417]CCE65230.1 hypothetical protein TPHA_0K00960 [Tetrapisispora phaffii CBS 4417]